jgi:hypothetical protein
MTDIKMLFTNKKYINLHMLFGLVLKRNLKFDLIRVIFTKGDTKTILILICLNTNNLATRKKKKKNTCIHGSSYQGQPNILTNQKYILRLALGVKLFGGTVSRHKSFIEGEAMKRAMRIF